MFESTKVTFLICLLIVSKETESSVIKWAADLGHQYPGITPLFSKLNDNNVALVSIQQSNTTSEFKFIINTYDIVSGRQISNCQIVDQSLLGNRNWDLKVKNFAGSKLALTWLYGVRHLTNIGVLVIDTEDCSWNRENIEIHQDIDSIYYNPYFVIPRNEDDGLDLFVKSPLLCSDGICKVVLDTEGKPRNSTTFVAADSSLFWNLIPVDPNDSSKGLYFISNTTIVEDVEHSKTKISKLSINGTQLHNIDNIQQPLNTQESFSNFNGNLAYCSTYSSNINCILLDSSLKKLIESINIKFNDSISKISVSNTDDDGFLLLVTLCKNRFCIKRETFVKKVTADGKLKDEGNLSFHSEGKCFPRKYYDGFFIEKEEIYCLAVPCVKKGIGYTSVYDVGVEFDCTKIV